MGGFGEILLFETFEFGEDGGFGGGEDAFEPAEESEREDDPAVLALFEISTKEIGDGPAVGGEIVGGRHVFEV